MTPFAAGGEDHAGKWREFSLAIVAVLGISVLAVLAVTAAVSAVQMGGMVRSEQERRARNLASFMARRAFVPVSLEDTSTLARIVDLYLDDPDMVAIEISDVKGRLLLSRRLQRDPPKNAVTASLPIQLPAEAGESRKSDVVGHVKVTLGLARVYGGVARAFRWIAIAGLAVLLGAGAVDLALIFWMTGRLRSLVGEAKLAEALKRSNQELEQFAFVASHDLQEPLRKIVSYCQLLEQLYKGKLDAQADEFMGIIIRGSKRMSALISDLLSFSRVGTQGNPLLPVDAATVLGEVLAMLQETIESGGASITLDTLPTVMADAGQLAQLFQNLIGNALKFRSDEPPRINVSVHREGSCWKFCVQDNGIGIEPKHRDRVFEMFKRLHSRDKYPGTGIGLAICKKIVERHGGRIWVESGLGRGSAFCFTLPALPIA